MYWKYIFFFSCRSLVKGNTTLLYELSCSLYYQTAFLPDNHTGYTLAEALETTVDGWKLNTELQQVCITTDSGTKIFCAIKW